MQAYAQYKHKIGPIEFHRVRYIFDIAYIMRLLVDIYSLGMNQIDYEFSCLSHSPILTHSRRTSNHTPARLSSQ